jgi:hypothetical protein
MEVLFVRHRLILHPVGRNPGLLDLNEAAADARAISDQVIKYMPWFPFAQKIRGSLLFHTSRRFDVVRKLSLSILLGP